MHWPTRHLLSDRTPVLVRLLTPEDREAVLQAFQQLSPDSRYFRFGSSRNPLFENHLHRILNPKKGLYETYAVINLTDSPHKALGAASFSRKNRLSATAEISFTISDEAQNLGAATLLLARLWTRAERLNIRYFTGSILFDNYRMLEWFRKLGAKLEFHGSTYTFTLRITEQTLKPSTSSLHLKERIEAFRRFQPRRGFFAYWRD